MNWLDDSIYVLTLIGSAAIIIITVFVVVKYIKQIKTDKSTGELLPTTWDEIGEYKNKMPIGWSLSFIGTMVWAIWYMVYGYPLNAFSQIGMYNEEVALHNERFEAKWANPDDEILISMGEGIFLVQCAPCHGVTADGIGGKSTDLTLWGTEAAIAKVIVEGSKGLNYPMGEMPAELLDEASAKAVAAYMVENIVKGGKTKYPELLATGEALWVTCTACHGEDAKGMDGMSPDLTVYNRAEFVVDVLNRGKKGAIGNMPSFDDGRLSDIQKLAVGKYAVTLNQ